MAINLTIFTCKEKADLYQNMRSAYFFTRNEILISAILHTVRRYAEIRNELKKFLEVINHGERKNQRTIQSHCGVD